MKKIRWEKLLLHKCPLCTSPMTATGYGLVACENERCSFFMRESKYDALRKDMIVTIR